MAWWETRSSLPPDPGPLDSHLRASEDCLDPGCARPSPSLRASGRLATSEGPSLDLAGLSLRGSIQTHRTMATQLRHPGHTGTDPLE